MVKEIVVTRGIDPRGRMRVTHPVSGELRVKQSLRDGTDINLIMERWLNHGASVVHLNRQVAAYGDFSSGLDYAEAVTAIRSAEAGFASLPARVRAKCRNDPAEFLQIVFDPERRDDLEGLDIGYHRERAGDSARVAEPGVAGAVDGAGADPPGGVVPREQGTPSGEGPPRGIVEGVHSSST